MEQARLAGEVITQGSYTLQLIMAEAVYVLTGYYAIPREKTADALLCLLQVVSIEEKPVVVYALELYKTCTLDFADCVLIAYNHIMGADVYSFDKKLNKRLTDC